MKQPATCVEYAYRGPAAYLPNTARAGSSLVSPVTAPSVGSRSERERERGGGGGGQRPLHSSKNTGRRILTKLGAAEEVDGAHPRAI
jgi:hypothetical protein